MHRLHHTNLLQKRLISLGFIAQHTSLTAIEFAQKLGLSQKDDIRSWLGRLIEFKLLKSKGKTKGKEYYIEPAVLKKHEFKGLTDLKNIPRHRLDALIIEDISRYGKSSISQIHQRTGKEIPLRILRCQLNQLLKKRQINKEGVKKGTHYFIDK